MTDALYIIGKAPRCGLAKTRLANSLGEEAALDLYRGFLRDLAARFRTLPHRFGWYVTPPDAWPDFERIVGHFAHVLVQPEGDLAARQSAFFARASARGEPRAILLAADSPQVPVVTIADAFERLDRSDVVFGPTLDGGYYLVGMRGFHPIIDGVPMGTATVYRDILARCRERGLRVEEVASEFDIDTVDDLAHLRPLLTQRADLGATAEAMRRHGLG